MSWHDLDHRHGLELRQDVLVDHVGIALSGAQLDRMVGQPGLGDVIPEPLPSAPHVHAAPLGHAGLGGLPSAVGVLLPRERPSRTFPAAQIVVVRRVPRPAVEAVPPP